MKLAIAFICMMIVVVFITTAFADMGVLIAQDDLEILFVSSSQSSYSNNLAYNTITSAIYSPVEQPAVITIYVQDEDMTPIGVLIFKTTLLAGTTPIEYGFTEPIKCAYNSLIHGMHCNIHTPNTIYVNVFKDSSLTEPLVPEVSGTMMV